MTAPTLLDQVAKLRAEGSSLYLGQDDRGSPVFGEVRDSAAVVGPQGCGKTSSVFVPSVACHPGPVIATSVRQQGRFPGLREATLGPRRAVADRYGGSVLELAVDDAFGYQAPTAWWDFTDGCGDWDRALDRAQSLARAGIKTTLENYHDWRTWVAELLAPLLYAARVCWEGDPLTDREIAQIVNAGPIDTPTGDPYRPNVADVLAQLEAQHPDGHPSVSYLRNVCFGGMHEETRQSTFLLTRSSVLKVFSYTAQPFEHKLILDEFLRGYGTLYITATPNRAADIDMIIGAFLEAVASTWFRIPYEERPPSLLMALDEVAAVAPIPGLPKAVGMYGGSGIQLLLGFQHSSQAAGPWGTEGMGVVTGTNHLMLFPGLIDEALTGHFSAVAPQSVQTHREVTVEREVLGGARLADADRLIRERSALEEALAGKREMLRRNAQTKALIVIRSARIKDGVKNRYGRSNMELLRELMEMTTVYVRPERRTSLEQSDIFNGRHDGRVFLKSDRSIRFVKATPYFKCAPWNRWCGPGSETPE